MSFYPDTLRSRWYMEDVCASIYASLEGTKNWTAHGYQDKAEREAYTRTFRRCQDIAINHHLNPEEMLLALDKYHDEIVVRKNSPFAPLANWLHNTIGAEEQAIRVAFDVVNSIKKRFL